MEIAYRLLKLWLEHLRFNSIKDFLESIRVGSIEEPNKQFPVRSSIEASEFIGKVCTDTATVHVAGVFREEVREAVDLEILPEHVGLGE